MQLRIPMVIFVQSDVNHTSGIHPLYLINIGGCAISRTRIINLASADEYLGS
jgi:hypothetical protein